MPVNNRWNIAEALDAARYYADVTGRRVSIEYALIRDVNDQPWRADLLGKRLHGALGPLVHVNAIPLNPTPGSEWDASPKAAEREFVKRVRAAWGLVHGAGHPRPRNRRRLWSIGSRRLSAGLIDDFLAGRMDHVELRTAVRVLQLAVNEHPLVTDQHTRFALHSRHGDSFTNRDESVTCLMTATALSLRRGEARLSRSSWNLRWRSLT